MSIRRVSSIVTSSFILLASSEASAENARSAFAEAFLKAARKDTPVVHPRPALEVLPPQERFVPHGVNDGWGQRLGGPGVGAQAVARPQVYVAPIEQAWVGGRITPKFNSAAKPQ